MELVPLMTLRPTVDPPVDTGPGALGRRFVGACTGGTVEGPRLSGTILPSGGDWLLLDGAGTGHVDGRLTLRTDDGAAVYLAYRGIARATAEVGAALAQGQAAGFGDMYYVVQPQFETGDDRYAWLTRIVTVAEGRLVPGGAEYRVFEIAHTTTPTA